MKFRITFPDAIDPIEPHATLMYAGICCRTEALNQRNRPYLCITPLESRLFDQKSRNGALNDLQY
jgi:hypothetical protein